ncbi:UNVERIFIED_CONTAM: hypothetical protein FKN15_022009 [Acipenser sinensis]
MQSKLGILNAARYFYAERKGWRQITFRENKHYEAKGKHDTAGNSAVLKLVKDDEVWVRMGTGALHGDHQRFCTFSGFLLFEN